MRKQRTHVAVLGSREKERERTLDKFGTAHEGMKAVSPPDNGIHAREPRGRESEPENEKDGEKGQDPIRKVGRDTPPPPPPTDKPPNGPPELPPGGKPKTQNGTSHRGLKKDKPPIRPQKKETKERATIDSPKPFQAPAPELLAPSEPPVSIAHFLTAFNPSVGDRKTSDSTQDTPVQAKLNPGKVSAFPIQRQTRGGGGGGQQAPNLLQTLAAAKQAVEQKAQTWKQKLLGTVTSWKDRLFALEVEQEGTIRNEFESNRASITQKIITAREQLTTQNQERLLAIKTLCQEQKSALSDLYTQHKLNLNTLTEIKLNEVAELDQESQSYLFDSTNDQAAQAVERGQQKAATYPNDERGSKQKSAVMEVAVETQSSILETLPEALEELKKITEDIPKEFIKQGDKAQSKVSDNHEKLFKEIDKQQEKAIESQNESHEEILEVLGNMESEVLGQFTEMEAAAVNKLKEQVKQAIEQLESASTSIETALDEATDSSVQQLDSFEVEISSAGGDLLASSDPEALAFLFELQSLIQGMESDALGLFDQSGNGLMQAINQAGEKVKNGVMEISNQVNSMLIQVHGNVDATLENLSQQHSSVSDQVRTEMESFFAQIVSDVTAKLDTGYTDLETKYNETLDEAEAEITKSIDEVLGYNQQALDEQIGAMDEAGREAGWRHDHPILAGLKDAFSFIGGLIVGILKALAMIVVGIIATALLVLVLIALGLSGPVIGLIVLIATLVVLAITVGISVYQRMKEGEGFWSALGNTILDQLGIGLVIEAFTNKDLTWYERGELIGEGVTTFLGNFLPGKKGSPRVRSFRPRVRPRGGGRIPSSRGRGFRSSRRGRGGRNAGRSQTRNTHSQGRNNTGGGSRRRLFGNKKSGKFRPGRVKGKPKTWNEFQAATKGQFKTREEAAQAWQIYKQRKGIQTGAGTRVPRSMAQRAAFLRQLGDSGSAPKWMNNWLKKGKVPPGYDVDHIIPLSVGGPDVPSNMRLIDRGLHHIHHKHYRPWEKKK